MADGLRFAVLAAWVGKKNAARFGSRRVTIGAVGWKDGSRFVMGTLSDGTTVLGEPGDFWIPGEQKAVDAVLKGKGA
jgi:hypothetical protein